MAICFSITAFGNIGETEAQMEVRYGPPQAQETNAVDGLTTKCYSHGGLWIRARFLNGSSQSEAFLKGDKTPFSGQEITSLLDSNKHGGNWTNIYKSGDVERWALDSDSAVAQYYVKDKLLAITTRELMKYVAGKGHVVEKPAN